MLQDTASIDRNVMHDVQRLVLDSQSMDDLCCKLAHYWDADEQGLQTAAMEWKERASTRKTRSDRAMRLLQFGQRRAEGFSDDALDTSHDEAIRKSRQIKLELLVEQIAEKVFPI
jgi:hypothetical protein